MLICWNAPRQFVIPHCDSATSWCANLRSPSMRLRRKRRPIYGVHGLSCRRSAGRHSRHSAVNDLIKRALTAAEIPARLEPSCLSRNDGKRPGGLTLVPWSHGRCLVWDFTCPDTLAISHLHRASFFAACAVAVDAEDRKRAKYTALSDLLSKCSTCNGDIRGSGRIGGDIFPGHWSSHCRRHWRAAIHSVPFEYRHPEWECSQCRRNCV